jgi:hypothetical protein
MVSPRLPKTVRPGIPSLALAAVLSGAIAVAVEERALPIDLLGHFNAADLPITLLPSLVPESGSVHHNQ